MKPIQVAASAAGLAAEGALIAVKPLAAVGVAVLVASVAVFAMVGARRSAVYLTTVGTFLAPLIQLRAGGGVGLGDVFLAAALGLVIVDRLNGHKRMDQLFRPPLLCVYVIVVAALFGTFWSDAVANSVAYTARYGVSVAATLLLVGLLAPTRPELRRFCLAYIAGCCLTAAWGIAIHKDGFGRAIGLSGQSNHLGIAAALAIALLMALDLPSRWTVLPYGLLFVGIVKSGSRAGLIAVVVEVLVFVSLTHNRRMRRLAVLAVVAGGLALNFGVVHIPKNSAITRLTGSSASAGESDVEREGRLSVVIGEIEHHPFFGVGFATAHEAHSVYLQYWQGAGLAGLAAILWLAALFTRRLRAAARQRDTFAVGVGCAFLAYLAIAVVSNQMWDRYIWLPLGFFLAAVAAPELVDLPAARSYRPWSSSTSMLRSRSIARR